MSGWTQAVSYMYGVSATDEGPWTETSLMFVFYEKLIDILSYTALNLQQ